MPPFTEKLPQEPLEPVADHRLAYACAYRDAEPAVALVVGFVDDDEMRGMNSSPSPGQAQELGASGKTGTLRKAFLAPCQPALVLRAGPFRRDHHGQPFPSLCPSPLEDLSAPGCGHAREETVGSLASHVARLVSPLHDAILTDQQTRSTASFYFNHRDGPLSIYGSSALRERCIRSRTASNGCLPS